MELKFICPYWGSDHLDFEEFLNRVKNSGYEGVEMSLPFDQFEKENVLQAIKRYDLILIAQHWETSTGNFKEHKTEYRRRMMNLATAKPFFINTQTGKDYFSFAQNAELIEIANEISKEYDLRIIHETHRGKFSFSTHITAEYLQKLPNLRLTVDLSHWCTVSESYLQDQQEALGLAIDRADHIHARVGFPEGPQIPDPRAPEWEEAVKVHIGWWKQIIELRRQEGMQVFTITPEFGPYPYMTILPFSREPISNQWEINVSMMNLLKSILTLD